MADVKSKDNKMNAFFYVIRKVWEKYQYPLFDREELELYQYTEKYPVSQINVELGQLRKYLVNLKKAMGSQQPDNDRIGVYCEEAKL